MSKIQEFRDWLLESNNLHRLVQLGLTKDKYPIDWLYERLAGDPEFEPWPIMTRRSHSIRIDNRLDGTRLNIAIVCEPEAGNEYGRPIRFRVEHWSPDRPTRVKSFDIPSGLSNLEVADLIIETLRAEYSAGLLEHLVPYALFENADDNTERLSRLVSLGLAPELTVGEWLRRLLDGDPDFKIETGTSTDRFSIHRPWAEHDLIVSIVRVLSHGEPGPAWSFKIRPLNALGELGPPTEHELEPGLSNPQIAERMLETLRHRWARPGTLNERALGNTARLRELGFIPKFKNTWEEVKFHLARLWPELEPVPSSPHSQSIEFRLPNGLRIELERHHFGHYTWWILDPSGEVLQEQDWTPPKGLSAARDWDEAIHVIVGAASGFIEKVVAAQ